MKVLKYSDHKLYESPHKLKLVDDQIFVSFNEDDVKAKPIAMHPTEDVLWIGDFGQKHNPYCPFLKEFFYGQLRFIGRMWFEAEGQELNILSFWSNIEKDNEKLKFIVDRLQLELKIDLSNWYLDTGKAEDGGTEIKPISDMMDVDIPNFGYEDELALHLLSPEEKAKRMRELGMKPRKPVQPKGKTAAQYKHKTTKFAYTETIKTFKDFFS